MSVKLQLLPAGFLRHVQNRHVRTREPRVKCQPLPVQARVPVRPTASGLSAHSVICNSWLILQISKRRQRRTAFSADWQRGGHADWLRSSYLSFHAPRLATRSQGGAYCNRRLVRSVRGRGSLCRRAAYPDSSLRRELPVGACDQRPHHRDAVVRAVRDFAVARDAVPGQRLSFYRCRCGRTWSDLPRPILFDRTFGRRLRRPPPGST